MLRARDARNNPARASAADLLLLDNYADDLAHFERKGWALETVALPVFNPPRQRRFP